MLQAELDRAVADATGDSVATIQRLGFLLDDQPFEIDEAEAAYFDPVVIDWDALEAEGALR